MKRFLKLSYLVAGLGGLGFFAMSVLLLGVWPGRVLERQIRGTAPDHPLPLTAGEQRGRMIYGQNGCAYCHTQQIRYLDRDVRRFGAATLAWETIFDYPQLWGTRRIGPDLSREGSVRSPDWELSHLYSPRTLVRDSVMPPFPWLFDGAPDRPKQAARDLLAYIETLGRNRELAGKEGEARARAACQCSDDEKRLAFNERDSGAAPVLNASAAMTRRQGDYPKLSLSQDVNLGLRLYSRDCASCHGPHGEGDGAGAVGLHPRPSNLAAHEYTLDRLSFSLWNGVAGTAMPAWRDLPLPDLSAIARVVLEFHSTKREPAPTPDVTGLGSRVYADHCAQCHGENGAGDGSAAEQFPIAPSNFRTQRPSLDASLGALRNGVDGTPMAPWTSLLSEDELSAVVSYVRGFFRK
jgi:cbb3-type cytochrome c oxidase subunit II